MKGITDTKSSCLGFDHIVCLFFFLFFFYSFYILVLCPKFGCLYSFLFPFILIGFSGLKYP